MIKATCNCGSITFEVHGTVSGIYVCHCSICRSATGAASIPILIAQNDDFRWTKGESLIQKWAKPGHDWQWWFCPTCSSPLPHPNDAERMAIPAGVLVTGHEHLDVIHHIYTDSKAHWDVIGDDGKLHPNAFGSAAD